MNLNEEDNSSITKVCTFWIGSSNFGVNIMDVKEINSEKEFTTIFHAPPEIKGYVNIRGQIFLVLDLKLILGIGETDIQDSTRLLLFKNNVGEHFGILVDRIAEVLEVDFSRMEDRRKENQPSGEKADNRKINLGLGVIQLEKNILVILDAKRFMKAIPE